MADSFRRWFRGGVPWWYRPLLAWVQAVAVFLVLQAGFTLGHPVGYGLSQLLGTLSGSLAATLVVFRQIRFVVRDVSEE